MCKFKAGDRVKRVRGSGTLLVVGDVYTVVHQNGDDLEVVGYQGRYSASYFELDRNKHIIQNDMLDLNKLCELLDYLPSGFDIPNLTLFKDLSGEVSGLQPPRYLSFETKTEMHDTLNNAYNKMLSEKQAVIDANAAKEKLKERLAEIETEANNIRKQLEA